MSQNERRMELPEAQRVADALAEALEPGCERVAIAGSVRRREPTVGDFEIVAIPRVLDLFTPATPERPDLDTLLERLIGQGHMQRGERWGQRHRQCWLPRKRMTLDLYLVSEETWGVQLAIRTGPAGFSKALVTRRCFGGFLPNDCTVHQGRIWRGREVDEEGNVIEPGTALVMTTERAVLEFTCGRWVHPDQRNRLVVAAGGG